LNEYLRLLAAFFAAVNPAAVAMALAAPKDDGRDARKPWTMGFLGAGVATVLFFAAVLVASPLLDWLQIEPETFRIAAGIVMAVSGAYTIWFGRWGRHTDDVGRLAPVFPLGLPLLAGPAGLMAALSYSVDEGAGQTFGAIVVWIVVGAILVVARPPKSGAALDAIARITGALLVAIAAGLVVSGVRAI
jgi:small neutral amino acid transporter SnatA (MarC family)